MENRRLCKVTERKDKDIKSGYFHATLEEGSLVMEPHCTCGNHLLEDYFCERCQKQCRCLDILCDNETTLRHVQNLIKNSEGFKRFKAALAEERMEHERDK